MKYTKRYFKSGRNKLRYFEIGAGKPVLFLHGAGLSAMAYRDVLDTLAQKYLVIAPDLPCFGESTCPESADEYMDILRKFIKHLDLENFAVIGHSAGGLLALYLADENKNIPLLVLVDAAGVSEGTSNAKFLYELLIGRTIHDVVQYKSFYAISIVIKYFVKNLVKRPFRWRKTTEIVREILASDFTDFGNIHAKTLVLWGKQDEVFSKKIAQVFYHKIKKSKIEYEIGNHDGCLISPQKFSADIIDWLKSNRY